jgi:hypothetical protein
VKGATVEVMPDIPNQADDTDKAKAKNKKYLIKALKSQEKDK